jgi:hypothetical protein
MDAYEARFVLSGLGLPGFGLRDVDSGACAVRPRDFHEASIGKSDGSILYSKTSVIRPTFVEAFSGFPQPVTIPVRRRTSGPERYFLVDPVRKFRCPKHSLEQA